MRTVEGRSTRSTAELSAGDRRRRPTAEQEIVGEEVLLDGNVEAEGHEFFSLGAFSVSPDGRLLAYSIDVTGAERFTLMIKDLTTGELLADQIDRHRVRRRVGAGRATSSTPGPTRRGDRTSCLRHRIGDRPGRGRRGADRAGRAVLARRRRQP